MILLTGATGFVGHSVFNRLRDKRDLRLAVRNPTASNIDGVETVKAELSPEYNWSNALKDVSVVIHCAARVHIINDHVTDPLSVFRSVNVHGTINLAVQAAAQGVRRFIHISSIGVNGCETYGRPFFADDLAAPHTPYAISKYESELLLFEVAKNTGMEVVIIRPPLVYGPNAPGNFYRLVRLLTSGLPIPLGGINDNRRSFVYIENLVDLIAICIDHPRAANQIFLVSDGDDVSTTNLLIKMKDALGKSSPLIRLPAIFIRYCANIFGKHNLGQSLCGSLEISIEKTKFFLGWAPRVTLDEGIKISVRHWLCEKIKST